MAFCFYVFICNFVAVPCWLWIPNKEQETFVCVRACVHACARACVCARVSAIIYLFSRICKKHKSNKIASCLHSRDPLFLSYVQNICTSHGTMTVSFTSLIVLQTQNGIILRLSNLTLHPGAVFVWHCVCAAPTCMHACTPHACVCPSSLAASHYSQSLFHLRFHNLGWAALYFENKNRASVD